MNNTQKEEVESFLKKELKDEGGIIMDEAFADTSNEAELRVIAHEFWDEASDKYVDLKHVLDSIHQQIQDQKKNKILNVIFSYFRNAAAVLLIPLLLASGFLLKQNNEQSATYTELTSPKGSRIQFVLPDGTSGFLNGGSTLRYKSDFSRDRHLSLDGECFFNVSKNKDLPFVVKTHAADIKVLGTHFDVCAYKGDNELTTTLEEGSVLVLNKLKNTKSILKPGQQNKIDLTTGYMSVTEVNTDLYTSWTYEMLRFDNTPFFDVVRKMERWYGVKIKIDDNVLQNEFYTMTIKTESLREMLQLLSYTTTMNYKIDKDVVYIFKPETIACVP